MPDRGYAMRVQMTPLTRALGVLLFLLSGCGGDKIVVLGDSNSCAWPQGCYQTRGTYFWPARLQTHTAWEVLNRSLPGMSAADYSNGVTVGDREPSYAAWHLDRLLTTDLADACARGEVHHPRLILALGTNDLLKLPPLGVAGAILALRDRALAARPCLDVYVATVPFRRDVMKRVVRQVNAVLIATVGRDRIVPFGDEPLTDIGPDGIHVTEEAQGRRADMALAALFP